MNTYTFSIPVEINGTQLKDELKAEDVFIREDALIVVGDFSKSEAESIIARHKPIAPKEPTIEEKLASVGLSIEELKAALGGN